MAQLVLQRACDRFRSDISPADANLIMSTPGFDGVKDAIRQIEQQLAARQELRNFDRLTPFLDAIETYSKALEVACNGTPYLPWIWAPIKLIFQAVHESAHALDKILVAYGNIASSMPRLSRFAGSFPNDDQFQQLIAFLFEDIIEFHRRAYALLKMPGWKFFFSSAWGRFEHRFGGLLESMTRLSDLIDREAVALDISQAAEWRKTEAENAHQRERQRHAEQLQAVLDWLETTNGDQEMKLEWLRSRCYEGTSSWITNNDKFRTWLQRGRGSSVLWLHGKPGSGKSVLSSQIIHYLRNSRRPVCFFICDYHTPTESVITHIFRSICTQIVRTSMHCVPYLYEEYVTQAKMSSANILKQLLPRLLQHSDDLRIVIDGIDEISASVHQPLIKELLYLTRYHESTCRLLIVSQDLPSISCQLLRTPRLSLNEEKDSVEKDLSMIIQARLQDIDDWHQGALGDATILSIKNAILAKAEGMFLWVHLILELLNNASNLSELRMQIENLPADLVEAYKRILNNISSRCSSNDFSKIKRIFSWMIYYKGPHPLRKYQVRVAMILNPKCRTMTRETRPFVNATDICKPFIEDGPQGSLIFVHSSVPQFLLDHSSGPFIHAPDSRISLASACMGQITQSLDILCTYDSNLAPDRYISTVAGFYALLPYAFEFWMDHLLDCLDDTPPDEIMEQLQQLCEKLRQLSLPSALSNNVLETAQDLDPRLTKLISEEEALLISRSWLIMKENSTLDQRTLDSRHLHRALKHYNETVQSLMGQTHVDGISQQELMAFQEEFGPTAFVCDFRRCERATFGFSSKARLVDHRARHDGILKCPVQGCAYNDVGFTTIKSLRGHQRNRHGGAEIKRVPKRFRQTLHEEANTWSHVPEYSYPALAEHQVQIVRWQDENQRRRLMTATQQQDNVSNIAPEKQHSNSALENYNSEKGTWKANKEPSDRDLSNFEIFEQQNENLLLMIARQELHNAVAEQESLGI